MEQNNQNYEEVEIDIKQYIKVIVKRKKALIVVFLLTLIIGLTSILVSPKIYRVSMMIQPPVAGLSLTGANDLEPAENLKGLIINGAYDEKLKRILNMNLDKNSLNFKIVIPSRTNILQVSIDLKNEKKDFGVDLLQSLSNLISDSYVKTIKAKTDDIISQIKSSELAIVYAKERASNLQAQIKEVAAREDKLREEIKGVNINTTQILEKRERLLKENPSIESATTLLLANYIQNNSSYLNQVNNQFSDLSIRRINLSSELKEIDGQIINFLAEIDKLTISKGFISNLKIIAQPRISANPISPDRKKVLVLSIFMGLFLGVIVVFLQEFWVKNLMKK